MHTSDAQALAQQLVVEVIKTGHVPSSSITPKERAEALALFLKTLHQELLKYYSELQ